MKIGDRIKILDKDHPFEGEVSDLTYFYVHLVTTDGDIITIPNSILLHTPVSVLVKIDRITFLIPDVRNVAD